MAPAMLMWIMNAMFAIFDTDVSSSTGALANILPPGVFDRFAPPDPDSGYKQRLGMLGALLTCPMGLVATEITRFTAVDTMPVVIIGAVNAATLAMIPIVFEALPL